MSDKVATLRNRIDLAVNAVKELLQAMKGDIEQYNRYTFFLGLAVREMPDPGAENERDGLRRVLFFLEEKLSEMVFHDPYKAPQKYEPLLLTLREALKQ